jgi:hypothetical protein
MEFLLLGCVGFGVVASSLLARQVGALRQENQILRVEKAMVEARLASFGKFDHDGDGRPGGSKPRLVR